MSKGGFRWGAGRPRRRRVAEYTGRVDVLDWHRRGYLRPGMRFWWSWRRGGELTGSVGVEVREGHLLLSHAWQESRVFLTHTPCHYGGTRPWFLCPHCGRRVAVLYLVRARVVCRRCGDVGYVVEALGREQREWRRGWLRWGRLGEMLRDGLKPKRMHWNTYRRLYEELEKLDTLIDNGLLSDFPIIMGLWDWKGAPEEPMGRLIVLTEEGRAL